MSTVGFRTPADHFAAELDRADCLLKALIALHIDEVASDTDPMRWGLSEVTPGEVAAFLAKPRPSDQPNFDAVPLAAKYISEAARKRTEIDDRVTASRPSLAFPLRQLAARFQLSPTDCDALLLLALPERHGAHRRIVAYLHDNGSRQWFSRQLLTRSLGLKAPAGILMPGAPLIDHQLVRVENENSQLRLDRRVLRFLDGAIEPEPVSDVKLIAPETLAIPPSVAARFPLDRMAQVLKRAGTVTLNGPPSSFRAGIGLLAAQGAGLQTMCLPADSIAADQASSVHLADILREAALTGSVLVLLDADELLSLPGNRMRAKLAAHPGALVLTGQACPSPRSHGSTIIETTAPETRMRADMWRMVLGEFGLDPGSAVALAVSFPIGPGTARRAAALAIESARVYGHAAPQLSDLNRACRAEAGSPGAHLSRFGQRIIPRPRTSFKDLVLPVRQKRQIDEIRHRAREGRALFEETGLTRKTHLGRGCVALFAGASGTGKTMAAELMAKERGIELFKINLAQLVSKWVGETEKNIAAIFAEARAVGAALFFDECDALFGKRGDVKEARDRWANLEVNHLLVELESHDGLVILATNLRRNIDEAFLRRIHAVIEFPAPDADVRFDIWQRVFPGGLKKPGEAEFRLLADAFDLTGGQIRNIALDAIIRAHSSTFPEHGEPLTVSLRDIVIATGRELQKLDRPMRQNLLPVEWGKWLQDDLGVGCG